jgi:hypothetical protein
VQPETPLETALRWHRLGCWVVPLDAETGEPAVTWEDGDERPDESQLRKWFGEGGPYTQVAIWLGDASDGWVAFDFPNEKEHEIWTSGGYRTIASGIPTVKLGDGLRIFFRSERRESGADQFGTLRGNGEWCAVPPHGHADWTTQAPHEDRPPEVPPEAIGFSMVKPTIAPSVAARLRSKFRARQSPQASRGAHGNGELAVTKAAQVAPAISDDPMVELAIGPKGVGYLKYDPEADEATWDSSIGDPPTWAKDLGTTGFRTRSGPVLLPSGVENYENEDTLLSAIRAFIHRYVELSDADEIIAAAYVLFTYVYDRFDEVPYLRFRSPDFGRGKSRALDVVGSICYRPLFAGGSSTAAVLRRTIDSVRGTLVGDEQDMAGDSDLFSAMTKILNQGFQRGRPLLLCAPTRSADWKPQSFHIFGPKVLVSRLAFKDDALESRFFTVWMRSRTRDDIPLNLPRSEFDAAALSLRNKLTMWRFRNWNEVEIDPSLRIEGVEDRLNQIAIPLLSAVRNETYRQALVAAVHRSQAAIVERWADSLAGRIAKKLVFYWKRDPCFKWTVGDLTRELNESLPPDERVTARKVGEVIRSQLGLKTRKEGKNYVIVYDAQRVEEFRQRLDQQAHSAQRRESREVGAASKSDPSSPSKSKVETADGQGVTATTRHPDIARESAPSSPDIAPDKQADIVPEHAHGAAEGVTRRDANAADEPRSPAQHQRAITETETQKPVRDRLKADPSAGGGNLTQETNDAN